MELCSGGDLYTRDPYTQEEAARIVSSIMSAVAYMHRKHICHRDLKYENILFVNESPRAEIKLIDFGLSSKYGGSAGPGSDEMTEGVGTVSVQQESDMAMLCILFVNPSGIIIISRSNTHTRTRIFPCDMPVFDSLLLLLHHQYGTT